MKNEEEVVTNEEADASIRLFDKANVVPATEFFDSCDILKTSSDLARSNGKSGQVKPVELKLLRAVVDNPLCRSSEYPRLAGISPNTLLKIRHGLVERGFIRENRLETNSRGRAAVLLEPLEPAKRLIRDLEEKPL